jgi:hypothetical protein
MAGEWIPIRIELPDDRRVLAMAARLNIDQDAVVGKLIRIWGWVVRHTVDGCARGATFAQLDRHVCCAGFCENLRAVGWLDETPDGPAVPDFERYLGPAARARLAGTRRMGLLRAARNNGDAASATPVAPEPSREAQPKAHLQAEQTGRTALPAYTRSAADRSDGKPSPRAPGPDLPAQNSKEGKISACLPGKDRTLIQDLLADAGADLAFAFEVCTAPGVTLEIVTDAVRALRRSRKQIKRKGGWLRARLREKGVGV